MEESLWNHVLTVKLICMVNVGIYIYVYHTYMDPKGSVFWKCRACFLGFLPAAYLSGAKFMLGTQGGDWSLVTLCKKLPPSRGRFYSLKHLKI